MLELPQPTRLPVEDNTIVVLKPINIVQAAQEDMRRRDHNSPPPPDGTQEYAFHRRHVVKAYPYAKELIALAIKEQELGASSSKRNTRLIYKDLDLLRAALQEA